MADGSNDAPPPYPGEGTAAPPYPTGEYGKMDYPPGGDYGMPQSTLNPPGQPGYPPAQPFYPAGQPSYPVGQPNYPGMQTSAPQPSTTVVYTQPTAHAVVIGGANCPRCGVGILTEYYGMCAIVLAICFFPLGLLCCLMMKQVRCSNCRSVF